MLLPLRSQPNLQQSLRCIRRCAVVSAERSSVLRSGWSSARAGLGAGAYVFIGLLVSCILILVRVP